MRRAGATQGDIGSALRADFTASSPAAETHSVVPFEDCEAYLRGRGYEFNAKYLRALHRAAVTTELEYYGNGPALARQR